MPRKNKDQLLFINSSSDSDDGSSHDSKLNCDKINLIIDNREKYIIKELKKRSIKFNIEALPVSDILICRNNVRIAIERKTHSDLIASIKDGRYREQKNRLLHERNESGCKLMYIIEKNSRMKHSDNDLIKSTILSISLRDKINVIETNSVSDTVNIIALLIKKLSGKFYDEINNDCAKVLEFTDKAVRKNNLTPRICFLSQLKQLPGISDKIASIICEKWKSMPELIESYNNKDNEDDRKSLLANIKISSRKLGMKRSENIYKYLYNK